MDSDLRALILPFSWFPPDRELFGSEMRSLSLLSHQAVKVMGLHVLDRDHEYADPLDEMGEVLAYAWLHTAPLAEIPPALWSGSWREKMAYQESSAAATLAVLTEWREFRERVASLLEVSRIKVIPRKKSASDDTPVNVISPTLLAHQIGHVAELFGETKEFVSWHLPVWEAWQLYHVAMRRGGAWTVAGGESRKTTDTFERFEIADLQTGSCEPDTLTPTE
jgi:hypothetical protein